MLKNIIPLILFFLLTPGILWTYSKKHNKYSIAILHAFVFAFIFYFIQSNKPIREGMQKITRISIEFKKGIVTKDDERIERIFEKAKKKYG